MLRESVLSGSSIIMKINILHLFPFPQLIQGREKMLYRCSDAFHCLGYRKKRLHLIPFQSSHSLFTHHKQQVLLLFLDSFPGIVGDSLIETSAETMVRAEYHMNGLSFAAP